MDPAVSRGLRPADETELVEEVPDREGDFTRCLEVVLVGGVQIDAKLVRMREIVGPGVPGIEVEAVHLRHPDDVALVERCEHPSRPSRWERNVDEVMAPLGRFTNSGFAETPLFQRFSMLGRLRTPRRGPRRTHEVVFHDMELGPALIREHHFFGARDANLSATGLDEGDFGRHGANCGSRVA